MPEHSCPICHDGVLERVPGRLDQSGDSYLPTVVWRCPRCEYGRFEPALGTRWRRGIDGVEGPARVEQPVAERNAA